VRLINAVAGLFVMVASVADARSMQYNVNADSLFATRIDGAVSYTEREGLYPSTELNFSMHVSTTIDTTRGFFSCMVVARNTDGFVVRARLEAETAPSQTWQVMLTQRAAKYAQLVVIWQCKSPEPEQPCTSLDWYQFDLGELLATEGIWNVDRSAQEVGADGQLTGTVRRTALFGASPPDTIDWCTPN
jgi:hypothetical protein